MSSRTTASRLLVRASACAAALASLSAAADAAAQSTPDLAGTSDVARERDADRDVRRDVPIVAYAYGAAGAPAGSVGAAGYGLAAAASKQSAIVGGGATAWGSPIDRLTLVGDAQRDAFGNFAPSFAAVVRLVGAAERGFSLGALGKFKVDGFHAGAEHDEIESEVEAGLLASYAGAATHLDANLIGGHGTGDDGETDVEGRLRAGRDLGRFVRLGVDSQLRVRATGPRVLGRTWDFVAGPQVVVGTRSFYASLTSGPTTVGIADGVGWSGLVSVGGVPF
jgi:hypothetical protein